MIVWEGGQLLDRRVNGRLLRRDVSGHIEQPDLSVWAPHRTVPDLAAVGHSPFRNALFVNSEEPRPRERNAKDSVRRPSGGFHPIGRFKQSSLEPTDLGCWNAGLAFPRPGETERKDAKLGMPSVVRRRVARDQVDPGILGGILNVVDLSQHD